MKYQSIALVLASVAAAPAFGQGWTQWSQNGHLYLAVARPDGISWFDAQAEAQAMGAELASATSYAENLFVFELVSDPSFWVSASSPQRLLGPWLGGVQSPSASQPNANWGWSSAEPWTWTNWSPGEPNDWQGVVEDRLQLFTLGSTPRPRWNDLRGAALMRGYVAEMIPPTIGSSYCQPTVPNSTGIAASLTAYGSTLASDQHLVIVATNLPADSAGYFLNGTAPANVLAPGTSIGRLCVGGAVGRYNAVDQIQDSFARLYFGIQVDLQAMPTPTGFVSVSAGQTWYFQAWYRDIAPGGTPTSNMTDAVSIQFQ